jgi:hypothetical protein
VWAQLPSLRALLAAVAVAQPSGALVVCFAYCLRSRSALITWTCASAETAVPAPTLPIAASAHQRARACAHVLPLMTARQARPPLPDQCSIVLIKRDWTGAGNQAVALMGGWRAQALFAPDVCSLREIERGTKLVSTEFLAAPLAPSFSPAAPRSHSVALRPESSVPLSLHSSAPGFSAPCWIKLVCAVLAAALAAQIYFLEGAPLWYHACVPMTVAVSSESPPVNVLCSNHYLVSLLK